MPDKRSHPSSQGGGDLAHALHQEWKRVENLAAEQVRRALRTQFLTKTRSITQPVKSDLLRVGRMIDSIHHAEPSVSKQDLRDAQPVLAATKIVASNNRTAQVENVVAAKVLRKTTQSDVADTPASAQQDQPAYTAERILPPVIVHPTQRPWRLFAAALTVVSIVAAAFIWLS